MQHLLTDKNAAPIVVNAAIGYTGLYLMLRLAEFQALRPDLPGQIVTRDQNTGFRIEDADIVVTFGQSGLDHCESAVIFAEELVPIFAPSLLRCAPSKRLDWVLQQRLLHMSSQDNADDWDLNLDGTGHSAQPKKPTDRIMNYMVYLASIQNGAGIGLGWRGLIERDPSDGRLVLATDRSVATKRAYRAILTPLGAKKPKARSLWYWCSSTADGSRDQRWVSAPARARGPGGAVAPAPVAIRLTPTRYCRRAVHAPRGRARCARNSLHIGCCAGSHCLRLRGRHLPLRRASVRPRCSAPALAPKRR